MSRKRSVGDSITPSDPVTSWITAFAPKDLAVQTQKVDSIRNWLKFCRPNKPSILLITGPPGCGKTACVRVVAEELGFELHEWLSPMDDEYSRENYQSQKDKFFEYLFRTSRYKSLFHQKRRLLLVEDFPNILIDQKSLFHDILGKYRDVGKSPLVFIASETRSKSLNIAYNLFPSDIQAQYSIHNISLNAISATLMKKALQVLLANLKRTTEFKEFREPTSDVLDSLIVSSQGDIRNAILNLQFVSQKNLPQVSTVRVEETSNKDVNSTKRSKRTKDSKLKEIGRDETISMLHGIGRVLNPKYDTATQRLTHSPELITEAFSTQPANFLLFLFSNYQAHFATVADSAEVCQALSAGDRLLSEYRDPALPQIALNVGIRGAMVANCTPLSGWHPVKGHKMDRKREELVEAEYQRFVRGTAARGVRNLVSKNTFVMDFKASLGQTLSMKVDEGEKRPKSSREVEEESIVLDEEERGLVQEIEGVDSDSAE